MNYTSQIRALKKQLKPVSNVKGMKRGEAVLDNAKITRKIYRLQKQYGHGVINHAYFKQIKKLLGTKSSQATVNKVKRLQQTNKQQVKDLVDEKFQAKIGSAVTNYLNDYRKTSAKANISATNEECMTLGKEMLDLAYLKHPDKNLTFQQIQKDLQAELVQYSTPSDSTNTPKGEPPMDFTNKHNQGGNQ